MTTIHRVLVGLTLSAFLPATASAQRDTDVRLGHSFANVKTFSFATGESAEQQTGNAIYNSQLIIDRTNAAVAAELGRLGLRRDDRNPDVLVRTHRSFHKETVLYPDYGWGFAYPYAWGWPYGYGYGGGAYAYEIVVGTLTVDLTDADSGQLLWRGTNEKRVHETSSPERRTKRINHEVTKIFEHFPDGDDD